MKRKLLGGGAVLATLSLLLLGTPANADPVEDEEDIITLPMDVDSYDSTVASAN